MKLWLVAAQPVVAIGDAGYDDRLFLNLARHLLNGEWLGRYDQLTLAKGPMYSLWIAGIFVAGVPLPLAQHLLYLLGCALLVLALHPHLDRGWPAFALFTLLWWQPMSYFQGIRRENLYMPLTLLLFAGLFALETRRNTSARVRLAWGTLLGLSGAAFWLTREESVWILPGVALLIGSAAWNSWRTGERFRPLLLPVLTAIICAAGLIGTVCALNYRYYGWFGTVEFRAREFLSAYGALQRPISSKQIPYVPVTREARLKLYDVSPAFAELKLWLEGTLGMWWAEESQSVTSRSPEEREIEGGGFMWALRDAVAAAGHAHSAREALDFYSRIATEVNRACDEGRVGSSRPRRDTMMPPWLAEHTQRLRNAAPDYVKFFFLGGEFSAYPLPSSGSAQLLGLFRDLTRWPLAPSADAPELDLPLQLKVDRWRLATLQGVGVGLRWLSATLIITGLGAWVWAAGRVLRSRTNTYLFIVSTAALGSAFAVTLVNLLVHVLSFPLQNPGLAFPLLILFGATAWIAATWRKGPDRSDSPIIERHAEVSGSLPE